MEQRTYNIFIGHSWAYNHDYHLLVALLKEYRLFRWRNVSSPAYDPSLNTSSAEGRDRLTALLGNNIGKADCVLIIPETNKAYLEWIYTEISIAKKRGRPVIVVLPPGVASVPAPMQQAADEVVGWSAASIVAAIRNLAAISG
jgi:Thoeris protein ThsB, TIR-like domain